MHASTKLLLPLLLIAASCGTDETPPPVRTDDLVKQRPVDPEIERWFRSKVPAAGMQIVTRHIKVVGQETCALPGGATTPCWHISKEMFSKVVLGKSEISEDVDKLAKGAVVQQIHEWYAPGIGVTRLEIGPAGKPFVSMALTQLSGR